MKILLDDVKLELLLQKHKDDIGLHWYSGWDSLVGGIGFLLTVFFSDFGTIGEAGEWIKIILLFLGLIYVIRGIVVLIERVVKKYGYKELYNDIINQNMLEKHPHTIVLLKDTFNENANRYLVYHDPRWKCKLFLNYHTMNDNDEENMNNIRHQLCMELKEQESKIQISYLFDKVHSKFSQSANKEKLYEHKFYKVVINDMNTELQRNNFVIEGKQFFWMSIAEMEADKRIMEVNADIVEYIKKKAG